MMTFTSKDMQRLHKNEDYQRSKLELYRPALLDEIEDILQDRIARKDPKDKKECTIRGDTLAKHLQEHDRIDDFSMEDMIEVLRHPESLHNAKVRFPGCKVYVRQSHEAHGRILITVIYK